MPRLIITAPNGKRGILELTGSSVVTVGRGGANDVVLNDSSVSRFHAVIKAGPDGAFLIADRASTNGVVLNGTRIAAETALRNGDVARVGVYELRYEQVDEQQLVVQSVEIPSTLHKVLRGEEKDRVFATPAGETPVGTAAELAGRIKKLERENYLLSVLYDAGQALQAKLSIDAITEQVMDLAFRVEGTERGFVMLFDENGDTSRQTEVRYRTPAAAAGESGAQPQIILSRSILERVKREQQPILIMDAAGDERFSESESLKISGLRSAMVAPLVGSKRLLGVMYLDNLKRASAFTQEELNILSLVAAQAAAAIDNALTHAQLAQEAVQRSALERFLSPEVVEMIAANRFEVKLGGQNQKVSVMFADIRGFTTISEKMAPERVVEILNEYFTRVTDIIFDNGGTLDKYLGDGVMALFGAPISKGNDAARAVRTAVAIQRLVKELNRDAAARDWPELKVGIGINTGIVTAGNIGSPRRLDYTVVGDTVNTAARLMAGAAPGQVLISAATAAELGGEAQLRALPPMMAKGKTEAIQVFSVEYEPETTRAAAQSN